jgi:hypothetical protein
MYGPCPNIWPFGPWLGLVKEGLVWADLKVVGLAPLISLSAPLCSALIVISSLCSLVASLRCAHSWLRSLSIDRNSAHISLRSIIRTRCSLRFAARMSLCSILARHFVPITPYYVVALLVLRTISRCALYCLLVRSAHYCSLRS